MLPEGLTIDNLNEFFPQFQSFELGSSMSGGIFGVCKAVHTESSTHVVLTIAEAKQAKGQGWTEEFMAKINAMKSVRHPDMRSIVDCGATGDGKYLYIAEEKENSPNLLQVRMGKPYQTLQALQLVRGLALAVHQARTRSKTSYGLLSPMTIDMVRGEIPKILPVRFFPVTVEEPLLAYLAPEVPSSLKLTYEVSEASEVYSLGMVLYFLLTGKVPANNDYVMPSCVCTCSEEVNLLVAKAIHPNPPSRFATIIDLVTAIESALPNCDKKPRVRARASALPQASQLATQGKKKPIPIFYYYVLPALIIGIVLAYTSICYRNDMKDIREEINKIVEKENKQKRHDAYESARKHPVVVETTTEASDTPEASEEKAEETAEEAEETTDESGVAKVSIPSDYTNWCRESDVTVKTTSTFKELSAYEGLNAIDGDPTSICATDADQKKESHINIDFGKGNDQSVEYIVVKLPQEQPQIGHLTNFRIALYNSSKEKVATKDFHTDGTPVKGEEVWKLDSPVSIRVIRIETIEKGKTLLVGEVEAWGE